MYVCVLFCVLFRSLSLWMRLHISSRFATSTVNGTFFEGITIPESQIVINDKVFAVVTLIVNVYLAYCISNYRLQSFTKEPALHHTSSNKLCLILIMLFAEYITCPKTLTPRLSHHTSTNGRHFQYGPLLSPPVRSVSHRPKSEPVRPATSATSEAASWRR